MDLGEEVTDEPENGEKGHADGHQKDDEANVTVRNASVELLEEIYTVRIS